MNPHAHSSSLHIDPLHERFEQLIALTHSAWGELAPQAAQPPDQEEAERQPASAARRENLDVWFTGED